MKNIKFLYDKLMSMEVSLKGGGGGGGGRKNEEEEMSYRAAGL